MSGALLDVEQGETAMSYFDVVQEFVEDSKRARNPFALATSFERVNRQLGVSLFACVSHVDWREIPPGAVALSNYPSDWVEYFTANELSEIDPVFLTANRRMVPFSWQDQSWRAGLTRQQLEVLEQARFHGLEFGVSFPLHRRGAPPASCSVAFETKDYDRGAIHAIHLMAVYLYEAAHASAPVPVFLAREPLLSERQKQCLQLVAQGKSDWVISRLLGISEATARFHAQSAMRKLGVASRTQAVARALYLGEIRYFDIDANAGVGPAGQNHGKLVSYEKIHVCQS